jgi:hypothetical protein
MERQRRQTMEEERGGGGWSWGRRNMGLYAMGGGLLREQVDEKYKVGDGTEIEGAKMQGWGGGEGGDITDPFARSTG